MLSTSFGSRYLQLCYDCHELAVVEFQIDLFHRHMRIGNTMYNMRHRSIISFAQLLQRQQILQFQRKRLPTRKIHPFRM